MASNTRIHDRRKRAAESAAARANAEDLALVARAIKAVHRTTALSNPAQSHTSEQIIKILERYVVDLQGLRAEIEQTYDEKDAHDALLSIQVEIKKTIRALARTKMAIMDPHES